MLVFGQYRSNNAHTTSNPRQAQRRARACLIGVAIAGAFAARHPSAQAADVLWSASPATSNWNTTDANWNGSAWTNSAPYNGAVFNTSSSTLLTVTQPVSAASIDFQVTGYDITGSSPITFGTGSSTLAGYGGYSTTSTASGGYSGIVDVAQASSTTISNTAEIDAPITSTVGFKKEGNGLLILGGNLNISGSYPMTGYLTYTTGAYVLEPGFASITSNLAVGGTTPSSGGTAGTVGGILRLNSNASLPATTSVSVGDGLLDLGNQNFTIAALTFPNVASVYGSWSNGSGDTLAGGYGNGVIGTGTLTVTGDIDVIQGGSAKNTIQANLNVGSGTQVIRLGSSSTTAGLLLTGNLSGTGTLTVVPGYNTTGGIANVVAQYGNMGLFGNNTNTGPMTFDTGVVSITGTNTASAFTAANAAVVRLMGANGSLGSVNTITLSNNATLAILNDTAYTTVGNGTGSAAAGGNNNRISDNANIVMRDATFTYNSAGGNVASTETYGSLNISAGYNTLNLNIPNPTTTNGTATLTANSLNIGPTASLLVSSYYQLGGTAEHMFNSVTDSATGTQYNTSGAIIPRVITYTTYGAIGYDLAYYDPVYGLSAYNQSAGEYYTGSISAGGNVSLNGAQSGITNSTVNALRLTGVSSQSTLSFDANNSTLNISSGMILVNSGTVTFQGNGTKVQLGTINFGSVPGVITGGSGNAYAVTSFLAMTGTGGLIVSGPNFNAYGSLANLSGGITINAGTVSLYEGQGVNGTVSTYATPGPINIRNGSASIMYTSLLPNGTTNSTTTNTFTEGTGLGDVNLGEPENSSSLLNGYQANPGPTASLVITGNGTGGSTEYSGSVFTRNINFNNGGGTDAGAALTPALTFNFPEVLTTYTGISETLSGNINLYSPGRFASPSAPTAYNSAGATLSGNISGSSILALDTGTYNLTGNLYTTGPIWIGPTFAANVSFEGNASSTSTSPIIGWGASGKPSTLAYNGSGSLPNSAITISNTSATGASAGINSFSIRPLVTGTSISNTININSDLTFNAPGGVVATWAGTLTGSSALYIVNGQLNIPPGATNTFKGPLTVNGAGAVLELPNGALTPSAINVSNGILAAQGTITAPLNVSGGTLFPGYGSTTAQTLTLPSTFNISSASTVDLNLTGLSGAADQLIFTSAPTLAGTLNVYNPNGLSLAANTSYQIFNYSGFTPTSTFAAPVNLPALGPGEVWNTSALYAANGSSPSGTISIVSGITAPDAWNTSSGIWETATNWTLPGGIPGGYGTTEIFGDVAGVTGPTTTTVTLTAAESSGNLVFNSATGVNYNVTGAALTMYNNSSTAATINVSAGTQAINSNVIYYSPGLNIMTGSGSLTFGGTFNGPGPVSISGTTTFNGLLTAGAVTVASGSTLNVNSPGPSTLSSLTLNPGSNLNLSGTLTPGSFSTVAGSYTNIGSGALFSSSSYNLNGGFILVGGTMKAPSGLSLTNTTLYVIPGGNVSSGSSVTLNSGSSLIDQGIFTAGSSTVTVNAGASVSVGSGNPWSGALSIKQGATVSFAGQTSGSSIYPIFLASLTTAAGSIAAPGQSTSPSLLTLGSSSSSADRSFLFAGSTYAPLAGGIDLGNGDFIDGTVYSYEGSSGLSSLFAMVKIGYNGGAWNGSSTSPFIFSSAAANDPTHLHALGIALNDTGANSGTATGVMLYPNFDNFGSSPYNSSSNTIVSGDVLIKYTYYGDANLSGAVDGSDYSLIDNGSLRHLTGWYNGDFNYDGVINGSDYTLIDNSYNTQGAAISAQIATPTAQVVGSGASSVPEPASLALLGIGAAGLLGRRRRSL
jgi:hypothetical protein